MRINTRLKLAVSVPVFMSLFVGLALFFSYQAMEKDWKNGSLVRRIRSSVTELNTFVQSYIHYHEERPKRQFLVEYDSMTQLIAGIRLRNPEQQRLLDKIGLNSESMKDLFLRLVSNYEPSDPAGNAELLAKAEERLEGQLLIRSRDMDADASRLRSMVDDDIRRAQTRTFTLILFVVLFTTIPLTIVLIRTMKSITTSLSTLRKGTEVIGSGNLGHRIGMTTPDELGDLSDAVDHMTEQLQAVTVSKDELQQEVEERKRAEEEIKKLNDDLKHHVTQLEEAYKELEAFSYSVSHDLRSPLRSIDGFSQALLEDYGGKLDGEGRDYLQRVRAGSQRMAQLIDDLLNLSRVARSEMSRVPVDLSRIAKDIANGLRKSDQERNVEFVISGGLTAQGDERLLRAAMENLFSNAWKFTSIHPRGRIEFGMARRDGQPVYFIKDDGVGFDMTYVGKLFGPFQRLHSPGDFPGTGIGLATVQRIIHRHGGRIWIEGAVEKGATVYFTL